jgi:hypothetical protein
VNHYLVRTEIPAARLRDESERRRRGERISTLLRTSGIDARWVECKTSWLWADVRDVIEASDERAAQAAADMIALAEVNDTAA